jgi:adenylate cyclase
MKTVPGRWIVLGVVALSLIVVTIAAVVLFGRPRGTTAPPPSIAVLPFVDRSPMKNQPDLSRALTEQAIEALSAIPNFRVAPFSATASMRGDEPDTRTIGRNLNVRSVLEASVEPSDDRIRITVKLLNAADAFPLWTKTYERDAGAAFALKDEIARDVAEALQLKPH